jgi:hypothetical protein
MINASSINMTSSLLSQTLNPKRDMKQETLSATVYLNYFTTVHDDKLIDTWFKTYLPLIRDAVSEQEMSNLRLNTKLKGEIRKGIPVPLRGHAWTALVGNKLRISNHLFEVFKSMSNGSVLNPLVEADIPRTFPHLNDLFEEIQSLSTSLREILQAY